MLPVSAIIPVRNGARFIVEAVSSVLAEEVAELVIVDDDSTDDTLGIVTHMMQKRASRDPRWIVVAPEFESAGLSDARNIGLRYATKTFVAMLDADDIWIKGKTLKQLKALENVGFGAYASSLVEHFLEPGFDAPDTLRQESLGVISLPCPSNFLAHRQVIGFVGGFDPDFTCSSDVDWYHRAHELDVKRIEVAEVLVRKRVHDKNLSLRDVNLTHEVVRSVARHVTNRMFPIEGY